LKVPERFWRHIATLKVQAIKGFENDPETGKLPYEANGQRR